MPSEGERQCLEGVVKKILWPSPSNRGQSDWRLFLFESGGQEYKCSVTYPALREGQSLSVEGEWICKKGSYTLAVRSYETLIPANKEGIIGFLQVLRGIGPKAANEIYTTFGDHAIEVLETSPRDYLKISGIGEVTLSKIVGSFNELRGLEKLIRFLASVGINSQTLPSRIYREYGRESEAIIRRNPYLLAEDINGIGFKTADVIAEKTGLSLTDPKRLRAGLSFALREAGLSGHVYLPKDELINNATELLRRPEYTPPRADLEAQLCCPDLPLEIDGDRIYLRAQYKAEVTIANLLAQRIGVSAHQFDIDAWIDTYQSSLKFPLARLQAEAATKALRQKVFVLTGGAGTGKSTVTDCIVKGWRQMGLGVLGVAPSGKAAKRLSECCPGLQTRTTHSALEFDGSSFNRDEANPLVCDALVVDESSMQDNTTFCRLLRALPLHASLLIVGDPYQLPSIGAGAVLRDLIQSGEIESVELTEVFRQSQGSMISLCANQVKDGKLPDLELLEWGREPVGDALFAPCEKEAIPGTILRIVREYLPSLGYKPDEIYVTSPQNKGDCGNHALNQLLQEFWNPPHPSKKEVAGLREGDRVLNTRNSKDKIFPDGSRLVNGDQGYVSWVNPIDRELRVEFAMGQEFTYSGMEIQDLILSYALSVHRCQGSEFPVVICPITNSHFVSLQRNLLYTALTRGKKLVIVVGEKSALQQAIRNNRASNRYTHLSQRLVEACAQLQTASA